MYVYLQSEHAGRDGNDLFTVGFYMPDGTWKPESDHATRNEAASRVAYLNGGRVDIPEIELTMGEMQEEGKYFR